MPKMALSSLLGQTFFFCIKFGNFWYIICFVPNLKIPKCIQKIWKICHYFYKEHADACDSKISHTVRSLCLEKNDNLPCLLIWDMCVEVFPQICKIGVICKTSSEIEPYIGVGVFFQAECNSRKFVLSHFHHQQVNMIYKYANIYEI